MQIGFFFTLLLHQWSNASYSNWHKLNYAQYEIHTYSVFLFKASLLCSWWCWCIHLTVVLRWRGAGQIWWCHHVWAWPAVHCLSASDTPPKHHILQIKTDIFNSQIHVRISNFNTSNCTCILQHIYKEAFI